MKIFPLNLVNKIEKNLKNTNPVLLYGNESGLISGLIKSIYNSLQTTFNVDNIKYFDHKNNKDENLEEVLKNSSLFSKINLIVIVNPQEELINKLKNIGKIENFLIINGESLRSTSKIRFYFDSHKSFVSVPCYKLDKNFIKTTIDNFIDKNKVLLVNDAYWYLVNNINEDFLTLENELQKLHIYKKSFATVKDLQRLIVQKHNIDADNYFFNCAVGNSRTILKQMSISNNSITESYEILISLKKFINILSSAVLNKDNNNLDDLVKIYLPKYLFLKKDVFKETIRKTTISKITKINKLLQKTEYLLRKNVIQHTEILERFLLNLSRIMK